MEDPFIREHIEGMLKNLTIQYTKIFGCKIENFSLKNLIFMLKTLIVGTC